MSDLRVIRGASPSRFGGIHWHEWKPKYEALVGPPAPDLVLLHPMPHDGAFFSVIAPFLAGGRTVIAPDYPGYGKSDALPGTPSIRIYADAMIDMLRARDTHGRVDLFGFHTGCLVATEMSLSYPAEIHRLVQVDVPYFEKEKREELLTAEWATGGFVAAFSYACEEQYPQLQHDTLVIATTSDLLEPSRLAAATLPESRLLELSEVTAPALENGAEVISRAALEFYDR